MAPPEFTHTKSDWLPARDLPASGAPPAQIAERAGLGTGGYTVADMHFTAPATGDLHNVAITGNEASPPTESIPVPPDVTAKEFDVGMSPLRSLYAKSLGNGADDAAQKTLRGSRFNQRMEDLAYQNPETFRDLAQLGQDLTKTPGIEPEQIGKRMADILQHSLQIRGAYGPINAESADTKTLLGALASVMVAARGGFDPQHLSTETAAMVDGMERELVANKTKFIHAVVYGDTKEPGLAVTPTEISNEKRHNFMD